ncbi:MAG: hypothetical protein WCT49_01010 [Candidatus Paceibacterota bacterium]|jgi:hypothetical protein|nr:hypothetical protein [Candidatus Paceibacterota bacterium]
MKHSYNKIKLCVAGAAATGHCGQGAMEMAEKLGREIAKHGAAIVTGATTGFPLWAAMGAKEAGGLSIGLSPASSEKEHVEAYRLPLDYMDVVVYTGFGYSGRNLLLTRSSDAVFVGCGRIGTINEFTVAYEDGKPVGVLEGGWMTDEVIKFIMNESHRTNKNIVFDSDPKRLVEKVIDMVQKNKSHNLVYNNGVHPSPYKEIL